MSSYPRSFTPLRPQQPDRSPLISGGRWPFRTQSLRLMILLFAAAVATLVLFSQLERPLLSEYTQREPVPRPLTHEKGSSPPTAIPVMQTEVVERPVEPVFFALLMYSETSAKEGAILLKSAIMYASRPLEFHIVCDEAAIDYLESRLRLLTHPVHPITVRLYRVTFQSMVDRITREGSINTGHSAGIPGLMKLFLHEILPDSVERAIYVDTDAFFLTDPALLWEEFSRWGPNVAVSIPYHPNMDNPEWYNASEICSCIMLLDLAMLRSVRLMDSSIYRADGSGSYPPALAPPTFTALFGPPGPNGYENAALGDQSYWWAIVSNRGDIFHPLPYDWEVTNCLLDMYGTTLGADDTSKDDEKYALGHLDNTPYEGAVIVPKLLHFNCIDDDPIYYQSRGWSQPDVSLTKRWGPAVRYHVGFKWLWLNRGHAELPIDVQLVLDPTFADQRFAAEHPKPERSDPGDSEAESPDVPVDTSERARRHPRRLASHRGSHSNP